LDHFVRDRFDDLARIACDEGSVGDLFSIADQCECPYYAFIAEDDVVEDDAVHTDQAITADGRSVDDGSVTDVGAFFEKYGGAGEHVDGTIFLDIASVFYYDASPVSPDGCSGSDVDIFTNDNIPCDRGLWMYEGRWIDDGTFIIELVEHVMVVIFEVFIRLPIPDLFYRRFL
jgi:hypothetical protein